MKRSQINRAFQLASTAFLEAGWTLPPHPRWDITDFGLGDFDRLGLVLVNLAEEPEYCEKLMYAQRDQLTPAHCHRQKKEDIICRRGELHVRVWARHPAQSPAAESFTVKVCGRERPVANGEVVVLRSGERITLVPGVYHEFWSGAPATVIGEVSTANDDLHDNFFVRDDLGRFPGIEEDEPALLRLISEK